jgi:hypothetical protein
MALPFDMSAEQSLIGKTCATITRRTAYREFNKMIGMT